MDLCQKVQASGASWITVHGRTSAQRHEPVNYEAIRIIKESVCIPVIANGDVKRLSDVSNVKELTGVDGKRCFSLSYFFWLNAKTRNFINIS